MPRIAVVFVSYLKVPESRLREHFAWNDEIYRTYNDELRVYVVSEVEHDLPDYAETVIVPIEQLPLLDGMPCFSLALTKNIGNAKALADGAEVVICTDVDVTWEWPAFERLHAIDDTQAVIPIYRMAESFAARDAGELDRGCTGTVGMTAANWNKIHFDENCIGYGFEDGILVWEIKAAGLCVIRDCEVNHIAHVPGDGIREPGHGSETCWGRSNGFNPDCFWPNLIGWRQRARRAKRKQND